ncbi:MAG: hypothetical protein MUE36_04140 [Acidimicrobiales bacterium]|jgi:uncharacterized membrane protein YphA (DoxX/SURF4 family)|nr:hypothetical protein [Acidimicrobiales bacterium]
MAGSDVGVEDDSWWARRDRVAATVDHAVRDVGPIVVRWLLGLMWLSNVNWKVPTEFGGLRNFVQAGVDHPVVPGSAWVFENVVLTQISAFGWMTLFVEVFVAAALLSGRALRTAAVVSGLQALGIGLAVANAPEEWYWSYLLMFGLSIAVLVQAGRSHPHSARSMGVVAAVYGAAVAVTNLAAGFTGDDNITRTLFTGRNDIPDEFGVSVFPGSVALGLVFIAVGIGTWLLAGAGAAARRAVGGGTIALAAVLLFTYRAAPDTLVIGLGSRAVHCAVLAALGLSLLPHHAEQGATASGPSTR